MFSVGDKLQKQHVDDWVCPVLTECFFFPGSEEEMENKVADQSWQCGTANRTIAHCNILWQVLHVTSKKPTLSPFPLQHFLSLFIAQKLVRSLGCCCGQLSAWLAAFPLDNCCCTFCLNSLPQAQEAEITLHSSLMFTVWQIFLWFQRDLSSQLTVLRCHFYPPFLSRPLFWNFLVPMATVTNQQPAFHPGLTFS